MKNQFFHLLQTNERLFKEVEENPANGLSYWQIANLENRYISPAFWKVLGYDTDDPAKETLHWKQLVLAEDHALFESLQNLAAPKTQVDLRFLHRQLGTVLVRNRLIVIPNDNNQPENVLILHSLSGPETENQRHSRTRRLKEIISTQGETMMVLDAGFRITEYYTDGMNADHTPLLINNVGRHFEELDFPKEVQLLLLEAINDAKLQGTKSDVAYKMEQNGKTEYFSASIAFMPAEKGHLPETVIVIKNVTAGKEAVTQLSELSSLAANTHDITILTDASGRITWVNKAFEDLTGKTLAEVTGKTAPGLVCGTETDKATLATLEDAFKNCTPLNITVVNLSQEGRKYWLELRLDPVFNEVGHCTHFVCIGRDVSQRILQEEELLATRQFLLQTNQVAKIGGWSYEVATDKVHWTDVMYDLHEVDHDFEPRVESVINFYEEGESRNRYYEAGMNAIQFGTPYDITLSLITAKGNKLKVRAIGNADMEDGVCTRLYGTFQRLD